MMAWQLETVRADFLQRARRDGLDDQGQAVRHCIAEGGEPCRDALRRARPGEKLILASYSPFHQAGPYREFGPVFVRAEADAAPIPNHFAALLHPAQSYLPERFALRAYTKQQAIQEALFADASSAQSLLQRWERDASIAFAMARFPAHGCYAFRLNKVHHD